MGNYTATCNTKGLTRIGLQEVPETCPVDGCSDFHVTEEK